MQPFPNDDLDPAQCGGDLIVQLSAGNTDTVMHALRDIAKHTSGGMQARWRIDGFASPPRPAGTSRATCSGSWTASPTRTTTPGRWTAWSGCQPGTAGEPAWTAGRQLPRGPADPDAGRVLGPGGHRRAGEHDRPPPRHRLLRSTRPASSRHPGLRTGPDRRHHPADRAHPAGQPADPADAPTAASCAAATTTTAASTRSATSTSGSSSPASSRTSSGSSRRCRHG